MTYADLGNALFELLGAALQWVNVLKLLRDKRVQGVYWPVTAFFAAWGMWNIYFYAAVGTPLSSAAAGLMTTSNLAWVYLAIKYRRKS
jgi:hypothetical protein